METIAQLIAEYRMRRAQGLTRRMAWSFATFYVPLPWRAVSAFVAGVIVALVFAFAAGRATAAEYRVSYSHPAIGARLVWARNLKVSCDGRAI